MKLSRTPERVAVAEHDAIELIPLTTIAGELASAPTVDELARRLSDDVVLDHIGRRCIAPELAIVLLEAERQRREEAEARVEAQRARHAAEVAARQQAKDARRRGTADAEVARHVRQVKIDELIASGLTTAEALVAVDGDGPPQYDGDHRPPRPSSNPFLFEADQGGLIGPPRKPRQSRRERQAAQS
jgi:hypothetical protein